MCGNLTMMRSGSEKTEQLPVTRGSEDVTVKLTAVVTYGKASAEKVFEVTVVKENEPVEGLQKLSYDEIIDVGRDYRNKAERCCE